MKQQQPTGRHERQGGASSRWRLGQGFGLLIMLFVGSGLPLLAERCLVSLTWRRRLQDLNCAATRSLLGSEEGQQVFVELLLVRDGEAMGRTRIDLQGRVLDDFGREQGRVGNGHDLVVVTMDNQGRHVERLRSSVCSVSEKALMQS